MNIGETIRKYRKEKNMTQEQMAKRLGVTTPAVNKWENGNSLPDVMLLSPIARLLDISLDTLLSHQKALSDSEAEVLLAKLEETIRQEGVQIAYAWLKEKLELYPNSDFLCVKGTLLLDVARAKAKSLQEEEYDAFVIENYTRGLLAEETELRELSADLLFSFYIKKEAYEKAEACLSHFPKGHPDLKRKQAVLYRETNRREDAYRLLEEMLFENVSKTEYLFQSLFAMALEENDFERAEYFAEKKKMMAKLFEMGWYHEFSEELELAVFKKDAEKTISIMEGLLNSADTLFDFSRSPLYCHMKFHEPGQEFLENIKKDLHDQFCDEESFSYMKENERWQRLKNQKIH